MIFVYPLDGRHCVYENYLFESRKFLSIYTEHLALCGRLVRWLIRDITLVHRGYYFAPLSKLTKKLN